MLEGNLIPTITNPLGAHWRQPDRTHIIVDNTHALMTRRTFDSLAEYSASKPTGVYPGKMWKRFDGSFDREFLARGGKPVWLLCWYGECDDPKMCSNNSRVILLADSDFAEAA